MKKLLLLFAASMFLLITVACSADDSEAGTEKDDTATNESEENTSETNDSTDESASNSGEFSEVDSIIVDGDLLAGLLHLSDDGEVVQWAEIDSGMIGDANRMKVWADGEVEELDMEKFNQHSYVNAEGNIYGSVVDHDQAGSPQTVYVYNPLTSESEKYLKPEEIEEFIVVNPQRVSDEQKTILSQKNYTDGEIIFHLWNYETDEVEEHNISEGTYALIPEIDNIRSGHLGLTRDTKSIYVGYSEGIVHYNTETEEVDAVSLEEDMEYVITPTVDSQYVITQKYIGDESEVNNRFYITDRDTLEQTEIGNADNAISITDGRILLVAENELQVYDIETGETSLYYTIELDEEFDLKGVRVSGDGNTIAYYYEEEVPREDDPEKTTDQTTIQILRK
ncbi:hypothetical protein [Oceanobacillus alkalisoli]|uniref:hypothetical protein n=1 Tax=Oceanobacillus alkalisoli TaxID=2925113 RepID=UPI001F11BE59|nr:hypothetical protein [Oceanobacillus alkalisoli]MCF3944532.1 hypothetical protein [Oceanobacillus alkalisoli]